MVTSSSKIFVQLELTPTDLPIALELQKSITIHPVRLVTKSSLHVTVIHIGLVEKLLRPLANETGKSESDLLKSINVLISRLEEIVASYDTMQFRLRPIQIDTFGIKNSALVITFTPVPELVTLHAESLRALTDFLSEVGISRPVEYMEKDANLSHALHLVPHLTIAKSYTGPFNHTNLKQLTFKTMRVVY